MARRTPAPTPGRSGVRRVCTPARAGASLTMIPGRVVPPVLLVMPRSTARRLAMGSRVEARAPSASSCVRARASIPTRRVRAAAWRASTSVEISVPLHWTSKRAGHRARLVPCRPAQLRPPATARSAISPAPLDITSAQRAALSIPKRPRAERLAQPVRPILTEPRNASVVTVRSRARPAITCAAVSARATVTSAVAGPPLVPHAFSRRAAR